MTTWYKDVEVIRNSAGQRAHPYCLIAMGKTFRLLQLPRLTDIDGTERYVLGIVNDHRIEAFRAIGFGLKNSFNRYQEFSLTESVKSLAKLPEKIPALWGATVRGEERDANGLVGVVGVARVSGEAVGSDKLTPMERLATFCVDCCKP